MKDYIKVGAFVKTERGQKLRILCVDGHYPDCPVLAENPLNGDILRYTEEGSSGRKYFIGDLIGPWIDPVPWDWASTCPWFNWLAQDSDGEWYLFDTEPTIDEDDNPRIWCRHTPQHDSTLLIPSEYTPKWTGDWKDSKTQRPEVK